MNIKVNAFTVRETSSNIGDFLPPFQVNTWCLRSLCWLLKYPLPSLPTHITKIANGMFVLLRNYATVGAAKGDNMELVSMLFKVGYT